MSVRGRLCGRQRTDGASMPILALLFRAVSAAAGRMGASSGLKSIRMFRKYLENVVGLSPGTAKSFRVEPKRRSISPGGESSVCHTPDRSGFPLEARGAFAERLGLPSGPRGVLGAG